jgi:hypothetical protein
VSPNRDFRLMVTIADFWSSLAGSATRAASRGVLGCVAPVSPERGYAVSVITSAAVSPKTGRRLLFAVTTAGASSATAFRFLGGRL